jgi:glutamyl-tRNA reductase
LILSTCLRFEIYAVVGAVSDHLKPLEDYLRNSRGVAGIASLDSVSVREGGEAVRHLFSVICGLDSHIIGEKQIVGQVKNAYRVAMELGCTGPSLNKLFQKSLNVSRTVRSRTGIEEGACSAASLAVKLLLDRHGSLRQKEVLILGAGQMGKLVGLHLASKGCRNISFCSRSIESAKSLAEQCSADYAPYLRLFDMLQRVDVLVTATGAPHEVIGYRDMQEVMHKRGGRALCVLDLADPPDVDPRTAELDGLHYYSLQCVDEMAAKTRDVRLAAAREAHLLIDEAARGFTPLRTADATDAVYHT